MTKTEAQKKARRRELWAQILILTVQALLVIVGLLGVTMLANVALAMIIGSGLGVFAIERAFGPDSTRGGKK